MVEYKSGQNTEKRILEAAMEIFCRDGIQGARMQDIADLANINRAMLHYYFRDKESLAHKAIEETAFRFHRNIQKAIRGDAPFDEKLNSYINEQINIYSQNPKFVIFALHGSLKEKDFMSKIFKDSFDEKQSFFSQLEEEIKKGRIRPFTKKEFIVFVGSLCAYPFIGTSVYEMIFRSSKEQLAPFWEEYKKHLPELIKRSIYTDYKE